MLTSEIRKIVILGAGRLAVNLSVDILKKGYEIVEVYNRTESRGKRLAGKAEAKYIKKPERITTDADLYIMAVSDAAIPALLKRIRAGNGLVIHTSGSVDMDVFKGTFKNYGVIYPPQTFSRKLLAFKDVPLCIEANSEKNLALVQSFASSLSDHIYRINSGQRKILHLAAVFANNFTNFMLSVSEELLEETGIDPGILEPIIQQTAENYYSGGVFKKQTGPAIRGDKETLREHLDLLSTHPDYQHVYDLITRSIIQRKNKYVQL
jgi:predicted short-subunit dehydrogenase-like oxidoreductase (DUF2520 family)